MHLRLVTVEGTATTAFLKSTLGLLMLLCLATGCGPSSGPLSTGGEPVAAGQPREWRVVEPARLRGAPALRAWHQAPREQVALDLARAVFPEFSWAAGDEPFARHLPAAGPLLEVRLPDSADGEVELASGPHVFHVRSLEASATPVSQRLGGALFYGPHQFRALAAAHDPGLGSSWRASRMEEAMVLESTRRPYLARYEVEVPPSVQSVRDARDWLEFLDTHGTPVLRLHYPVARDAQGLTRQARVTLHGLDPQRLERGGLPLYRLRDSTMRVELTAAVEDMQGPVLLAVIWSATGSMAVARQEHTATLLLTGEVLVAGGHNGSTALDSAELYDPATRTWTGTGAMGAGNERAEHTATLLRDGRVLVIGGFKAPNALGSAMTYERSTGTWTPVGVDMTTPRYKHTATLLNDGKVLVVGGRYTMALSTAQVYDPTSTPATWSTETNMGAGNERQEHTATLLSDGRRVLVVGGINGDSDPPYPTSVLIYDPTASPVWTTTTALGTGNGRREHTATLLPDGKVLITGGRVSTTASLNTALLYDPTVSPPTWSSASMGANQERANHTATLLPDGKLLVTGGADGSTILNTVRIRDSGGNWSSLTNLATTARQGHTATLLPSGRVLITGGAQGSTILSSCQEYDLSDDGAWSSAAALALALIEHTSTLLPDGKVLVAGGRNGSGAVSNAQVYDPTTGAAGTWSSTATMSSPRYEHTATLLNSGGVLVVGGRVTGTTNVAVSTAEVYDPGGPSAVWRPAGTLTPGRFRHTATLLRDGRVLVAGGRGPNDNSAALSEAWLYNPTTNTWSAAASLPSGRFGHTATLLSNGKVLIAGGRSDDSTTLASALEYDPSTNTWANTSNDLPVSRSDHTATLLPSGRVLVVGGRTGSTPTSSATIYDPSTRLWSTTTPSMSAARAEHAAVLLPSGRVLVAGGRGPASGDGPTSTVYVYDPALNSWSTVAALGSIRADHTATLLPSGRVLVAGGEGSSATPLSTAQLYSEATVTESWRPSISSAPFTPSTRTLTLTGLRLRGLSEASSGNHQSSSTGFPFVSLMRMDGSGQWRMRVTSFSAELATVEVPADIPDGHYLLSTLVNAISGGTVVYLDTVPPPKPVISAPLNNTWVNTTTPVISGTAEPGSTITVREGGTSLGTATANVLGNWSFTPPAPGLSERPYTVTATAVDRVGLTGVLPSDAVTFTVDTTPPAQAPMVSAPANNGWANTRTPLFTGTAEPSSTVTVTLGTTTLCTATAAATTPGSWSCTSGVTLSVAQHTVTVRAADRAGNLSPSTSVTFTVDETAPAPPVVTDPVNNSRVGTQTPTFSGTAEPGSTVDVVQGATTLCTATAGAAPGNWSCVSTSSLAETTHTVAITARDAAGNTSTPPVSVTFTVDQTPPSAPTVSTPMANGWVNTQTPTFSGTAEPGSTVTVTQGTPATTLCITTAVAVTGSWNCVSAVALAAATTHTVTVSAADQAGNTNPTPTTVTFTVDLAAPPAPVVAAPASNSWANTQTPAFSGTAEPFSTVTVTRGTPATTLCTANAAAVTGNWNCTPAALLAPGSNTVTVSATDRAGNVSNPPATVTFTVDILPPPAPVVAAPANNGWVSTTTPLFSGTAEPSSTITVTHGSPATTLCTTIAAATPSGDWSCISATLVAATTYTVTVTATDQANNASVPPATVTFTVDTLPPPAPTVTAPANNSWVNTQTPTFSGTAELHSTVSFSAGAINLGSTTASGASGGWTHTATATLPEGTHTVAVRATDQAGNSSTSSTPVTITVDVTPPAAPMVASPLPNAFLNTFRPTFSGTAELHSIVTLTIGTLTRSTLPLSGSTNWSIALDTDLAEGPHVASIITTDRAGNVSASPATVNFTVDRSLPLAPTVTEPANNGWVNSQTPTFRGTSGTAEPFSTVSVRLGPTLLGFATATVSGSWSVTSTVPLDVGMHTVTVTATDRAGNASATSTSVTFTVDLAPPAAPLVAAPANNGWVNVPRPAFNGTAEPFSTITLTEGGVTLGTTTLGSSTAWSIPLAADLSEGSHSVTVTATDRAGNVSAPPTLVTFTVDTVRPPAPVVTAPANNGRVGTTNPIFSGTAEPSSTVTVAQGATILCTATAAATAPGGWNCTSGVALSEAAQTVTVSATDRANNTSTPSTTVTFTVDLTPPDPPMVDSPRDGAWVNTSRPVFSGSTEARSTVTLTEGGLTLGSVTLTGTATNWSISLSADLIDGPHTVLATATDRAGNTSTSPTTVTFTVDTVRPPAPLVSSPTHNGSVNTRRPTFTGTAEPSSTVTVTLGTTPLCTTTAAAVAPGGWSCTPSTDVPVTTNTVTVSARDRASNVSATSTMVTFTVDLTRPDTPVVTAPLNNGWVATQTPTFTGTAEAFSTVTLTLTPGSTSLGTATADALGNWSVISTVSLSIATHTVTAIATDQAGNSSLTPASVTFTVDTSAPPAPVVTSPAQNGFVNTQRPTFSGTAEEFSLVTVSSGTTTLATATANSTGNWSAVSTVDLAVTSHTLTATARDRAGNFSPGSAPVTFTVDTASPSAPVITQPANGSSLNTLRPTFSGTAESLSTVIVSRGTTVLGSTTADTAGAWSLTSTVSLIEGSQTVTATATDRAGNVSAASAAINFTVDVTAPSAPVITSPVTGRWVNTRTPTLSGTAEALSTVKLYEGPVLLGTINANSEGIWTLTLTTALSEDTHTVTATATDRAGLVSPPSAAVTFTIDLVRPDPPVVTSPVANALLNTGTPTFRGTAEPLSTVRIFVDANDRGTALTSATGAWEFTPTAALTDGRHDVAATATDRANNTSLQSAAISFFVDASAPAQPVVTAPANGALLRQARPTITGTAEAGSTLDIVINGTSRTSITATATWSYTPNFDLPQGLNTLRVDARDTAGNVTSSNLVTFTVDSTPPSAPTINVPAAVGTTPTFTGTADPGSTVSISVNNGQITGTIIASNTGVWSFTVPTPLGQGSHSVQATSSDPAGNISAPSPLYTFDVDTSPPEAPLITSLFSGQTLNDSTPTFSGTAEPLSTVAVFVNAGQVGSVSADGQGTWSYTLLNNQALSEGAHKVYAIARDRANNASPRSSELNFIVDSVPPGTPEVTNPLDGAALATTRPRFEGKADANSTVTLLLNGNLLTAINVPAAGTWSFQVSAALPNGAYELNVTAKDAANNVSTPARINFTVDTGAPPVPVITTPQNNESFSSNIPTLAGTAEAGSAIILTVDGRVVGEATASDSQLWSYSMREPLAEGSHTLRAQARDAAGNVSATTGLVYFFVDTVSPGAPSLTSLADGAFISDTTPTLSGSAEAGSTVILKINNSLELVAQASLTSSWSITPETPLAEGAYTLILSSRDAVGNTNPGTQTIRFTVDTTTPDTRLSADSPRLRDYPPTATFEFFSSEQGGSFECSYKEADFAPCRSPHDIENLDDGEHLFRVRAVDRAGNIDPEPVEYKWSRDLAVMEGGGCGTPGGASLTLPAFLALLLLAARRSGARAGRGRWGGSSLLLLALLALGGVPHAQAQEPAQELTPLPAVDLERLYLNPGRGTLLVGGGELLLPATFRVSLGGHYQNNPLRMRLGTQRLELISHRVTGMLAGAVGVLPWLEVAVQVPVVPLQRGQDPSAYGLQSPASQGLGTPMAHARMGILSRRAGHLVDLAVDVGLGLPLGSTEALAREPIARLQGFAMAGRRLGPVRVAVDGGLLVRVPAALGPANLTQSYLGQELRLGAGVSTVGQGLQLEAALRTALALETARNSAELLAGIRYPLYSSWLEVFAMGGVGLGSLPGTPGFRVVAGVSAGHPPPPETPVTRRASSWQQPLLREDSEEGERPQPLRAPPIQSDDEP